MVDDRDALTRRCCYDDINAVVPLMTPFIYLLINAGLCLIQRYIANYVARLKLTLMIVPLYLKTTGNNLIRRYDSPPLPN